MSNRIFQGIIHQMKDAAGATVGVIDEAGVVVSCSDLGKIGEINTSSPEKIFGSDGVSVVGNYTYRNFGSVSKAEYAVFVEGTDESAKKNACIIAVALSNIKQLYDEKHDRSNFIKNVILDNILPGDIYLKARELHFNNEVSHAVLLIRTPVKSDISVFDAIQNLFPDRNKDFVVSVNETDIALIKEVNNSVSFRELEELAATICDAIQKEFGIKIVIGIGSCVVGIKNLASSFRESQVALEVMKVFDTERNIVSYNNLGIARLIYQLPTTLCEMFLNEVMKKGSLDSLDQETLLTIQKFFENNLNVSETSRKLFVHRNTLVYRVEKIKKLTGLDLREFDDAIVFKVALMVKKYLDSNPVKY